MDICLWCRKVEGCVICDQCAEREGEIYFFFALCHIMEDFMGY